MVRVTFQRITSKPCNRVLQQFDLRCCFAQSILVVVDASVIFLQRTPRPPPDKPPTNYVCTGAFLEKEVSRLAFDLTYFQF
jgi:hypothetical protein